MSAKITLDEENKQYVIDSGEGITCWGFDRCFSEANAIATRLGNLPMHKSKFGTMDAYNFHGACVKEVTNRKLDLGTWFSPETAEVVRQTLESARIKGTKVRLWYGDRKTGRAWLEENDVIGKIGRSTGVLKIPLLLNKKDGGGLPVLDGCIIRIDDATTKKTLCREPKFHVPSLTVGPDDKGLIPVFVEEVDKTKTLQAHFPNQEKADQYIAFMTGEDVSLPGPASRRGGKTIALPIHTIDK